MFVSELYTGSISDRELTKRSGFLKLASTLQAETSLMVDCGFDFQDVLAPYVLCVAEYPAEHGKRSS